MKTKEFIKRVRELGYNVKNATLGVFVDNDGTIVCIVDKARQYRVEIYNLLKQNAKELFDLCVEYAQTPIEEREVEEKFYLQKIKSFYDEEYDEEFAFLNFDSVENDFWLNDMEDIYRCRTQFTQEEIDKIKEEQSTDLSEFEQIPVEEMEECID